MQNIFFHLKAGLTAVLIAQLLILLSFNPAGAVYATADGSPAECENPDAKSEGNTDLLTATAPDPQTISGVCIKSGTNMFGGTSHSGLLGNGTYEDGCYTVSGVGTGTVTVTRSGTPSDTCQGLSHIDVFYSPASSPTPTPTPSPSPETSATPTPTPTPSPTPTPTTTTTTTTTTGGGGGGAAAGAVAGAAAVNPAPTSTPAGAVLGAAAELPETGTPISWPVVAFITLISGTYLTIKGLKP